MLRPQLLPMWQLHTGSASFPCPRPAVSKFDVEDSSLEHAASSADGDCDEDEHGHTVDREARRSFGRCAKGSVGESDAALSVSTDVVCCAFCSLTGGKVHGCVRTAVWPLAVVSPWRHGCRWSDLAAGGWSGDSAVVYF